MELLNFSFPQNCINIVSAGKLVHVKYFVSFFKTLCVCSHASRPHLDVCLLNSNINQSLDGTYLLKLEIAGFVHPAPLLHRFPAVWLQNEILQHGKKSTRQLITKHSRKSSAKFKIGKSCRKPRDYVVLISRLLYVCMVPLVFCLIFKPR